MAVGHYKNSMIYYELSIVCYIFAFLFLLISFYFNRISLKRAHVIITALAMALNSLQFFTIGALSASSVLMMITLSLAAVYMWVGLRVERPYIGFFMLPCLIAAGLLALFLGGRAPSRVLENLWLYAHVPLAIVGMAFLAAAFASGIMYFILDRQIKKKNFGRIFERFPSLAAIDKVNSASLFLGFAFYTAGLLAVAGWIRFRYDIMDGLGASFYAKTVVAALAWVVTSVILLVRLTRTTTARGQALASVVGGASLCLTYIAVTLFALR